MKQEVKFYSLLKAFSLLFLVSHFIRLIVTAQSTNKATPTREMERTREQLSACREITGELEQI